MPGDVGDKDSGWDFEELVRRAVQHPPMKSGLPHWARVSAVFGVGSTTAGKLCETFGVDPDEVVYVCEACGKEAETQPCSDKCGKELSRSLDEGE